MRNRFVIGIGSQRAGTTLLHRLLGESTNVFMHPVKELHYFDTINGVRPQAALTDFSIRQLNREIDAIVAADKYDFIDSTYKCMLRANKMLAFRQASDIQYSDLFRPMLMKRELLGEATPEYMLLSKDQVREMSKVVGTNAVIILLCRDPVKRLVSSAKLFNVYNNLGMDNDELSRWLTSVIERSDSWIAAQDKYNDYEAAANNFTAFFPNFLALSFEKMISYPANAARQLEEALETRVDAEAFIEGSAKVSNRLSEQRLESPELINMINDRYAESRRFLQNRLGSAYDF